MGAGGNGGSSELRGIAAELASPGAAEAGWVRQSENRLGLIEAQLREIETRNGQLEQDNARLQAQLSEDAQNAREVIDRQAALIEEMSGGVGACASCAGRAVQSVRAGGTESPDGRFGVPRTA